MNIDRGKQLTAGRAGGSGLLTERAVGEDAMSGVFDLTKAVDGPATGAAPLFATIERDLFLVSFGLVVPVACNADARMLSTFSTIECRLLFLRRRFLSLRGGSGPTASLLEGTLTARLSSRSLVSSESESTR